MMYQEVLNDHDERLITFFQVLRGPKGKKLIDRLLLTPYSESEHKKAVKILRSPGDHDDLTRAWAYYVAQSQSFSGILCAGWSTSPYHNVGERNRRRLKRLEPAMLRLLNAVICKRSAIDCIRKFDSPSTFFYCDPPYVGANQGHYSGYTIKDHNELIRALKDAQGSAMVSLYRTPEMTLPRGWKELHFDAYSSAANKAKKHHGLRRTETIWLKPARGELDVRARRLYESGAVDCYTGDRVFQRRIKAA